MGAGMGKVSEAFIKFIGSKEKLSKYAKAMKYGKQISDKASEIQGSAEALERFIKTFEPLKIPLQIVASSLSADVTANVMDLMVSLMEGTQTETFQKVMQYLTILINLILENATKIVDFANKMPSINWEWGKLYEILLKFLNLLRPAWEGLERFNDEISRTIELTNPLNNDPLATPVNYTMAPEDDLGVEGGNPPPGDTTIGGFG